MNAARKINVNHTQSLKWQRALFSGLSYHLQMLRETCGLASFLAHLQPLDDCLKHAALFARRCIQNTARAHAISLL